MQKITIYAAANETLGAVRDSANARPASAPIFTRDVEVELHLRLFANPNEPDRYILPDGIVSWGWYMDTDFDTTTAFKIVGDNADIVVSEQEETTEVDPATGEVIVTNYGYTDIKIPISNLNSEALVAWLGTEKSQSGLIGELCGYDAAGDSVFVLQIENFTVRNRISESGMPSEDFENYLTIDQARALFGSMESSDGNAFNAAVVVTGSGDDDVDGVYRYYPEISLDWYSSGNIMKCFYVNDNGKAFIRFSSGRWSISKKYISSGATSALMYIYPWKPGASNINYPPTDFWYKSFGQSAQPAKDSCFVRYCPRVNVIQTSY